MRLLLKLTKALTLPELMGDLLLLLGFLLGLREPPVLAFLILIRRWGVRWEGLRYEFELLRFFIK
jgi:hypothetical protein